MNPLRLLKRFHKTADSHSSSIFNTDDSSSFSMNIGGLLVRDLQPVKKAFQTKRGNISLMGTLDGKKVKISTLSRDACEFRNSITRISDHIFLPTILASTETVIIEEWVTGNHPLACTSGIQERVHNAVGHFLSTDNTVRLILRERGLPAIEDYLEYLYHRVKPWLFINEVRDIANDWNDRRRELVNNGGLLLDLSHPDLSYDNIVVHQRRGTIYCVDNELLNYGYGSFMDFYNSLLWSGKWLDLNLKPLLPFMEKTAELRRMGSRLLS